MVKKIGLSVFVLAFLAFTPLANAALVSSGGSGSTTTTTGTSGCSTYGASSWTPPTSTAPAGNVTAPINVGSLDQQKDGHLTVGTIPCPTPIAGWVPVSKFTVNGITDTDGFSNWGATFLQGLVSIGSTFTVSGTAKVPKLYVKADPLVGTYSATNLPQSAALFAGSVGIRGSLGIAQNDGSTVPATSTSGYNTIYVQGIPVCLQNGSNCPTASTGTTTAPSWTVSGTSLYNTNPGTVMLGTATNIYPSTKLFVSGTSRIGADVDYGTSPVLSVAPGTVNFDGPGVLGGHMSIDGSTGQVTIQGALKLGGSGAVTSGSKLDVVGGGINVTGNESHFANTTYTDPAPGYAYAIKATSVATTVLHAGNIAPLYTVISNPSNGYGCAYFSDNGSSYLSGGAGTYSGYYWNGITTTHPYCGGSSGHYIWPLPVAGYLLTPVTP